MSDIDKHLHLFKGAWVANPELLRNSVRAAKVSDTFTAELAAWCAEIHEQLRDLQDALGVELMLMGGNGASLRFDAVAQRGSRDNDYLTVASAENIERLMKALGDRFAALPGALMKPARYQPKKAVRELNMKTYEVAVPLRLNHGNASDNRVKVEFHFEDVLPPGQTVVGVLGPAGSPSITAWLPALPYQLVIKLMSLAGEPVGIDEVARRAAVPRQLYDLDGLAATLTQADWTAFVDYCRDRYAHECAVADIEIRADEPFAGLAARLRRWAECLEPSSEQWRTIQTVQSSQLRRASHRSPWGWRARALRLLMLSECARLAAAGWEVWERAGAAVALVPVQRAKAFRPALAELSGAAQSTLPLELHDFAWDAVTSGSDGSLADHVARAERLLAARTQVTPATQQRPGARQRGRYR